MNELRGRPRTTPGEGLQPLRSRSVLRVGALIALGALLLAYYFANERAPELGRSWDVAFLSLVLMPAAFGLVWLVRGAWTAGPRRLGVAFIVLAALTVVLERLDLEVAANFAKFGAATVAGWWFLAFFDAVSWVLLVALLIIPVDAVSVARGPTRHIVEQQPEVFYALSVAFPIPGEHAAAHLGLPDVLFFALFLAAAERFGLRTGWTAIAMALSFGVTMAAAVWLGVAGLPALPLLSAAFVLVNADLLWRTYRRRVRRVAALYDVHGNLPALEAVLAEVEAADIDLVVVGGDVAWGPFPGETLRRLRGLGPRARFIVGNADREVVFGADEVARWCAEQLSEEERAFLAELPLTETLPVDGVGRVLFCHGSPRSDEEPITEATSSDVVREMLAGVDEGVVVCGHTHAAFDRRVDSIRVVNPGSVGLPFGAATAHWAVLGPDVEFRETSYDVEGAAERIRESGVPEASWFADHLTAPPSWETANRQFTIG
jgi:putative phosphoesterase